jgi:hypothetical protein
MRPSSAEPSPGRLAALYGWFRRQPDVAAALVYSAVALAAFVTAYVTIFSQFTPYDDEGTLLTTLQAFVEGDALYRDVFSPYGPFYYEVFGGLFALTGWPVSTDASRLIVVVIWVATSGLYGLVAHRLTGRLALGVGAMIVAFAVLGALVGEPMHPHGLATLLIAAFALLVVLAPGRRVAFAGALAGACLAGVVLTKINLGAFAFAAVALAAVLTVEPLNRRRWVRWPVIAAFLVMPTAVMVRDLAEPWVRDFIVLQLLASLALVVAASAARPGPREGEAALRRWLLGLVGGAAGLAFVSIGVLLALGLSVADVYDGIVTEALGIRDTFVIPFSLPDQASDWAVAALAGAVLAAWMQARRSGVPSLGEGLLRTAAGVLIWIGISRAAPFTLSPAVSHVVVALLLAWVAAWPPADVEEGPFARFVRVLLPALAVGQVLQVYPVAGNQQSIAAVTFVPVGALCLADGLRILGRWSSARGVEASKRFAAVVLVLSVAFAGKLALEAIVRPGITTYQAYDRAPAVDLPGAGRLHLLAEQAGTYERLVDLLHENRCSTFLSYPGLNSFYLWSSLRPPRPQLPGPWMVMLNDAQQREALAGFRASRRPCAIRNDPQAEAWLQRRSPAGRPLVRYLVRNFRPVEQIGEFQFLLPRASAAAG